MAADWWEQHGLADTKPAPAPAAAPAPSDGQTSPTDGQTGAQTDWWKQHGLAPSEGPPEQPLIGGHIDPNQPEALQEPPGTPAARFAQGLWANTGAAAKDTFNAISDMVHVFTGRKKEFDPTTIQMGANLINAHKDQMQKAQDAMRRGEHVEAFGHYLASVLPAVGPVAAHAGERMGSYTPAVYDKYGNVIQPGQAPDIAGGLGEGFGLIFPSAAAHAPQVLRAAAPALKAVPRIIPRQILPLSARAAGALEDVSKVAGALPVDTSAPVSVIQRAQQLVKSGGGQLPQVMRNFLDRINDPKQPPLTFNEGRDFYSNTTGLSVQESSGMSKGMYRQIGQFRDALNSSLEQTAGKVGKLDQYRGAMKEYHGAQRNLAFTKNVGKFAVKKAVQAAPIAGAAYTIKKFTERKAEGGAIHKAEGGRVPSVTSAVNYNGIADPSNFRTELSPAEEAGFQTWLKANRSIPAVRGWRDTPRSDYDMRGFYQALQAGDPRAATGVSPFDRQIHFTDAWKTPYHRTFSNESIYASPDAPHWEGDRLIDKSGRVVADETPVMKARGGAVQDKRHPEVERLMRDRMPMMGIHVILGIERPVSPAGTAKQR